MQEFKKKKLDTNVTIVTVLNQTNGEYIDGIGDSFSALRTLWRPLELWVLLSTCLLFHG